MPRVRELSDPWRIIKSVSPPKTAGALELFSGWTRTIKIKKGTHIALWLHNVTSEKGKYPSGRFSGHREVFYRCLQVTGHSGRGARGVRVPG